MSRIVLSEAARIDRREITAYTVDRFGIRQARRLREQFQAALERLPESPTLGKARRELDPEGHSFRYFVVMKSFIIVDEPANDGIRVARLLHSARDLAAELDRDAGDA
ncbi:MAG: type II toxin-antitoxin system RelE/ParE family toxin [Planctomycetes bacterium]|nr:type II toxin-antitoxin system RelE/ParE family toxin [Planctomycetota bacterium]